MRKGHGKNKGSAWERAVCKALSRWVTDGKQEDCFWRSSLSGGRATVQHRRGVTNRQAGDICSVSPEGHALTDTFFIECKHVRQLKLESFLLTNKGLLAKFWKVAQKEATKHSRAPMIIAKQNNAPAFVITRAGAFAHLHVAPQVRSRTRDFDITLFDALLKTQWEGS